MWKRKDMIWSTKRRKARCNHLPPDWLIFNDCPDLLLQMFHFVKCDWTRPTHGKSVLNLNFVGKSFKYKDL